MPDIIRWIIPNDVTGGTLWFTNQTSTATTTNSPLIRPAITTSSSFTNLATPYFVDSTYWFPMYLEDVTPAAMTQHLAAPRRQPRAHVRPSPTQADIKARDLLLRALTPDQRASLERDKWFVVEGKSGHRYRVRDVGHTVANIDVLDKSNRLLHRLCGHIRERDIPLADHLLAQKLMLEADEEAFVRLANRHAVGR